MPTKEDTMQPPQMKFYPSIICKVGPKGLGRRGIKMKVLSLEF